MIYRTQMAQEAVDALKPLITSKSLLSDHDDQDLLIMILDMYSRLTDERLAKVDPSSVKLYERGNEVSLDFANKPKPINNKGANNG